MKLYRFSPIQTETQLLEAVMHIVVTSDSLCRKICGNNLPITSVTVFAHYPNEFDKLVQFALSLGTQINENNGPRVRLHSPLEYAGHSITELRIRKPDPYRMQVGCNDYETDDYEAFKQEYLEAHPENLRLITRPDYEMIEFSDPDFDVLAYVVSR